MTIQFLLTPRTQIFGHPSRERTTYIGPCRVSAANERAARLYASMAFGIATARPGVTSPWMDRALVDCSVLTEGTASVPPEGRVMLPEGAGRPDFMALGPEQGEIWSRS